MNEHDIRQVDPLADLVERAEGGDEFTLTRDGRPVAVLIGWDRWRELQAGVIAAPPDSAPQRGLDTWDF